MRLLGVGAALLGKKAARIVGMSYVSPEYFTDRILRHSTVLGELAPLAAADHERYDGFGYPRNVPASTSRSKTACSPTRHR